jgi:hypothetical protein
MAAVTISRTTFTDDDGSGTTGDVWGAVLCGTAVYDKIDAMMATVFTSTTELNSAVVTSSLTSFGASVGAWTTPTFDAARFTAGGSMTWTVAAGDVTSEAYMILGKTMWLNLWISTSTVGGTPATSLRYTLPASKTAAKYAQVSVHAYDNGVATEGRAFATAGGTYLTIYRSDLAAWTASTDDTTVALTLCLEIQ